MFKHLYVVLFLAANSTGLIHIFSFLRIFSFQCLEQEKHVLRRKLSEAESDRDIRIQDLESDYNDLKSKLMSQVIKFCMVLSFRVIAFISPACVRWVCVCVFREIWNVALVRGVWLD